MRRSGAHDETADRRIDRLDVFVIGADDADVRERETDDLSGIGRIAQDLLIAGHRGVETDLAHGLSVRAEAMAFEDCSVGECEPCAHKCRRRSRGGLCPWSKLTPARG